jgi:hypothetical protein
MRHVLVWALKRGVVNPPEPVSPEDEQLLQRESILAAIERDEALSHRQWVEEEGWRSGYSRRKIA